MYSQMYDDSWKLERSLLNYMDRLNQKLNSIDISLWSFEGMTSGSKPRNMCIKRITTFERLRTEKPRITRQKTKHPYNLHKGSSSLSCMCNVVWVLNLGQT